MGAVGALAPGLLQSRNHIVPFETIQNDLANYLNDLIGADTDHNQERLINLATGPYDAHARALLSSLNSSPDNVRLGSRVTNLSIGENLDADFNPGTTAWPGGQCKTSAGVAMVPAQ